MIVRGKGTVLLACFVAAPVNAAAFSVADTWDWQLTEPADLNRTVDVLALHPDVVTPAQLGELRKRTIKTICYVSIGTLENGAQDRTSFPAEVIGKTYEDWPDERFLDVRRLDVLLPIMTARFRSCREMGFDAVEPDNMDVHDNDSGFPVTADDVVAYVARLARAAHEMGLQIGQKNVPDLTGDLVSHMDFAITESCFQDSWCEEISAYILLGKPVFDVEYTDRTIDFTAACAAAESWNISMILKDRDLTAPVKFCP